MDKVKDYEKIPFNEKLSVRVVTDKGRVFVVGIDLCKALKVNHNTSQRLQTIADGRKTTLPFSSSKPDKIRYFVCLDKDGVHELANRSMKLSKNMHYFVFRTLIPDLEEREESLPKPKKIKRRKKKKILLVKKECLEQPVLEEKKPVDPEITDDVPSEVFESLKDERLQVYTETGDRLIYMLIDGEPMFLGTETARYLGYKRPSEAIQTHVNLEDTVKRRVLTRDGCYREIILINEGALNKLIIRSNLPEAEALTKRVTHTILPSIRKTGSYSNPDFKKASVDPYLTTIGEMMDKQHQRSMEMLDKVLGGMAPINVRLADLEERQSKKFSINHFGKEHAKFITHEKLQEIYYPGVSIVKAARMVIAAGADTDDADFVTYKGGVHELPFILKKGIDEYVARADEFIEFHKETDKRFSFKSELLGKETFVIEKEAFFDSQRVRRRWEPFLLSAGVRTYGKGKRCLSPIEEGTNVTILPKKKILLIRKVRDEKS